MGSGIESKKTMVLGSFAVLYSAVLGIWLLSLFIYRLRVSKIHVCFLGCLLVCALVSIALYAGFDNCNRDGEVSWFLRFANSLASSRWIMIITVIVLGINGWGDLPAQAGWPLSLKIFGLQVAASFCMMMSSEYLAIRHFKFFDAHLVRLALFPQCLLGFLVLVWIIRTLTNNMRQCVRTNNTEPLKFFQRIAITLAVGVVIGAACTVMQFMDAPLSGISNWHFHVLATYLIPDAHLLIVLVMLLAIWSPHASFSFDPLGSGDKILEEAVAMKKVEMPGEEDDLNVFASSDEDAEAQKTQHIGQARNHFASEDDLEPVVIGAVE